MEPYLPPYVTSVRRTVNAPSASSSTTYNYDGLDEIRKRQNEANQLAVGRYQQLYGGDVAGSVASGQRIRDLLSSISSIEPVKVASQSSSSDMGGRSIDVTGSHEEPGATEYLPPNRMKSGARKKSMSNSVAGNPRGFRNDGAQTNERIA